jgi:hypothetical protein
MKNGIRFDNKLKEKMQKKISLLFFVPQLFILGQVFQKCAGQPFFSFFLLVIYSHKAILKIKSA